MNLNYSFLFLQVCIRANVSSESIHEAFSKSDRHRYRKKSDHEDRRDRSARNHPKEQRNFSSNSASSSDLSECSSDGCNYKSHRRRRRQRQYSNRRTRSRARQCSRSRSRSCCHCSADEESPADEDKSKPKVHFQTENIQETKTEDKSKHLEAANQVTVTAMVHREDQNTATDTVNEVPLSNDKPLEEQKPSESSESGIQEIQNQKLDTDTDVCYDEKKPKSETPETSSGKDQNEPQVEPVRDETAIKCEMKSETEGDSRIASANCDAENKSERLEEVQSKTKSASPNADIKNKDEQIEKVQSGTDNIITSALKENKDTHDSVVIEPIELVNANDEENVAQTNGPDYSSLTESASNTFRNSDVPPASVVELEKFKTEKLEEHFAKDKGLICVILDDDETIEIKRRKDVSRCKSEHHPRTRSATRKKEKSLQKRQRRSRSSFEILSDDANNDDYSSRLTVQDDSGFEPSPRNSGQAKFEGRPISH